MKDTTLKRHATRALKKSARIPLWYYRLATARWRSLPQFVVIGAQKAGSSSFFYYLCQHPQILPSMRKGVHFFDGGRAPHVENDETGELWYRAHFPLTLSIREGAITGEASPRYIFHPLSPGRMANLLPRARIIALLRDPVERAISQYFMSVRKGFEDRPVLEAFRREEARLAPLWERKAFDSAEFLNFSYKSRGLYKQQLDRYFALYPREQVLVLGAEELFCTPQKTLETAFRFLGVDPGFRVPNVRAKNVGGNRSDVDEAVYAYLRDFFAEPNRALFETIGKTFDW